MMTDEKNRHFLLRAGFGMGPDDLDFSVSSRLLMKRSVGNSPIDTVTRPDFERMKAGTQERKVQFQHARQQILELNNQWVDRCADPELRLREKMTLFWHDHFACRVRQPFLVQQQNNVLRKFSLASFGELLRAVSKDPAMLQFLNNQQNKKNSPNENFAREVLELFTLGRGNYTEQDIKNGARAFTGWAFNPLSATFAFREKVHDAGIKTFLGKTGNFSGDDILDLILDNRQTAKFITGKIFDYFVQTGKPDQEITAALADSFFRSGFDIGRLMTDIFTADWFYEDRFRGNRIKSPVELLAGIMTQTGGTFDSPQAPLFIQRALSQILFFPPNVGGWPSGTSWIDSSSLAFRTSLPNILLKDATPSIDVKDDGDVNSVTNMANAKKFSLRVDWTKLATKFVKSDTAQTLDELQYYLVPRGISKANRTIIEKFADRSQCDLVYINKAFVGLMSLPDYQLS